MSTLERREARAQRITAASLVTPATLVVALGLLIPIAILFRYSLNDIGPYKQMVDAVTIKSYLRFFADEYYTSVLVRTFRVAVVCTVVCLLLGFPLAYVLARLQSTWKNWLIMLVVLPLFVGNAVRAAGWMALFGSKGVVNATLLGFGVISTPIEIMYTEGAVIIGIIAVNLPFMVLTLQSVIEGIDRAVEEAAFSLGANPAAMFRRVLWPLALPGTLAGTILTFILAMNAYATPVLLGGPRFVMMGPLVYNQFVQQNNWPFGAAISFVLMTATIVLTATANILVQRRYRR
ncbi:MAG: ABC transporter permease [Alphaproteobacteria bacterium]|nr:ABC transporter permease [Alphaproteobacteria bacterium]